MKNSIFKETVNFILVYIFSFFISFIFFRKFLTIQIMDLHVSEYGASLWEFGENSQVCGFLNQ